MAEPISSRVRSESFAGACGTASDRARPAAAAAAANSSFTGWRAYSSVIGASISMHSYVVDRDGVAVRRYLSSGPYLFVQFSSVSSITSPEFAALTSGVPSSAPHFIMTESCPGPASFSAGTFTTLSLTSAPWYSASTDCAVVISSGSPAAVVVVTFVTFDTRSGTDYVDIFDGPELFTSSLGSLSGPLSSLASSR